MNANEILELIRAGYTKAEIETMGMPADSSTDMDGDASDSSDNIASEQTIEVETNDADPSAEDESSDNSSVTIPNHSNAAELDAIKKQIADQTKDLNAIKDSLITQRINNGTAEKNDINIYDMWADALNN